MLSVLHLLTQQHAYSQKVSVIRRLAGLDTEEDPESPKTRRASAEYFVDQMRPEDVGFSFCIRGAADFRDTQRGVNFNGDATFNKY